MSPLLGAYLTGALVGAIVGALIAVAILSRVIDRATTLPDPRRPLADDDTARIELTNLHDLRRPRSTFEETA